MRRLMAIVLVIIGIPMTVQAGGSWLDTPDEHIELGEQIELVGYVGLGASLDLSHKVMVARLYSDTEAGELPAPEVQEFEVIPTGLGGYLSHRVYLRFTVPLHIEPGVYHLSITGKEGEGLGDLIGAYLHLGVRGPIPSNIEWALDEPLIAHLPDYATITGPEFEVLVGDLRAGRYPPGAADFMLDPSVLDQPGVTIVSPTTTTTAVATPAPPVTVAPAVTTAPITVETVATAVLAPVEPPQQSAPVNLGPLLVGGSLMLLVVGLVGLAARRREVLVVLGRRPMAAPAPTDGGESIYDYVTVDDQSRH